MVSAPLSPPVLAALAAGVLLAGTASALLHAGHKAWAGALKMTAATGYLALAWASGATASPYGQGVLVAMALCWLGDLLLIPGGSGATFLGGLGAFLLGHVAFAVAFVLGGVTLTWAGPAGAALVVVAAVLLRWLWAAELPSAMQGPVVAYVVAISVMVALAWGGAGAGASWLVPAGAVAFMASDVFVARERFVTPSAWNTRLGLPLYFLAQVLLALSV